MKTSTPRWKLYERFIARLAADQTSPDLCVTPNARIKGRISRRSRQIDVLIDARYERDFSRRIIVDAKHRGRKMNVQDVESLEGLMKDVGASHGYLVCPNGHTAAAERRAQNAITIGLVPLNRLRDFTPDRWDACQRAQCKRGHVFWDGYPTFKDKSESGNTLMIQYSVGKCDHCGLFHVRCHRDNEIFSLGNRSAAHRCSCEPPWFWLASIEKDPDGFRVAELHVVHRLGKYVTVDRRAFD